MYGIYQGAMTHVKKKETPQCAWYKIRLQNETNCQLFLKSFIKPLSFTDLLNILII